MSVQPMVIDLSHWDPAHDFSQVKKAGYVGCIFKATQSTGLRDNYYVVQQHAAKAVGLQWGAYHFGDNTSTLVQADNFLKFASPDPDELFALDWEEYGSRSMSLAQVILWVNHVEEALNRPNQCVIYGPTGFLSQLPAQFGRRLWVARYGPRPTIPFWLWQYTDGHAGFAPHVVPGVGRCDINSYEGAAELLAAGWATGKA